MPEKKESTVRKASSRRKISKGDSYVCEVCGLSLIVDEECGCADVHEILCCGQPMKEKRTKVKSGK